MNVKLLGYGDMELIILVQDVDYWLALWAW
jgi:hypothetical protein